MSVLVHCCSEIGVGAIEAAAPWMENGMMPTKNHSKEWTREVSGVADGISSGVPPKSMNGVTQQLALTARREDSRSEYQLICSAEEGITCPDGCVSVVNVVTSVKHTDAFDFHECRVYSSTIELNFRLSRSRWNGSGLGSRHQFFASLVPSLSTVDTTVVYT